MTRMVDVKRCSNLKRKQTG